MNKLFKYGFIVALLTATACTDLDLVPQDKVSADVLFQDESAYRSFLARVYAGLAVTGQAGPAGAADISSLDEGFSNYLRQYWQFQELTTDEAIIAWGDDGLADLHNHTWTDANQFARAIYYRIFFQVSIANEFLRETTAEKLDSRGVSDATRNDVDVFRAEARFLRALSYWHGIDLLGDIPFYTEEQAIGSEPPMQGSREEIFNFLDSELQAIESDMVAPGQNEYGRADQAALCMLQAKLYQMEMEKRDEELAAKRGAKSKIGFGGTTVRNYVLHPDQYVKDARTATKVGNPQPVLDGDIDVFLESFLRWTLTEKNK